jgi:RES domain-containing protein
VLSPRLVDAIDRLDPVPYRGDAYRHVAARWHPLSGAGARAQGGRWNPPESFATLYLAVDETTVIEEFRRMASRFGRAPEDFVPRRLYRYGVELQAVLDLTGDRAQLPGPLAELDFASPDLQATQAVGEAAQYLGREAVRAPSATGRGDVLAVFIDRLQPDSVIQKLDFELWEAPP